MGPSKGPMTFLIIFAGFCFGYLVVLIQMFAPYNHVTGSIAYFTVIANLVMFFMAMCKDPGIDDVIYDHYFKTRYGMKLDEETEDVKRIP